MDNQAIGKRIREIRKKKRVSQEEIAAAAGVTQAAISLIENGGGTSDELVRKISEFLRVSYLWLRDGHGVPDDPNAHPRIEKTRAELQAELEEAKSKIIKLQEYIIELHQRLDKQGQ